MPVDAAKTSSTANGDGDSPRALATIDVAAELRVLLATHESIAAGGTFKGVQMKRTYLWLKRAERLLDALLVGASQDDDGSDGRADARRALRAVAYDMIEHCDWMSDVLRHDYRKLVARLSSDAEEQQPQAESLAGLLRYVNLFELKVTKGCNLPCTYCNMDAESPAARRMSMATFRDAVSLLMRHGRVRYPDVEFHGGEPLLLPDAWYEEAVATAQGLAEQHGKRVRFRMVTNGILLDDERIDCLHRLGIGLCLSLDGPPVINDVHRKNGELVERAVRRLEAKNVPFAMLTVITDANASRMKEVLDYFGELGVECITTCFNQPQGRGLRLEELSVGEKLSAMATVVGYMAEDAHRVTDLHVARMVQRFVQGRDEYPALACTEKECLAGRSFVTVDPVGDLYACATDLVNHRLGNIYGGVSREHVNRTLLRLHEKDEWFARCNECPAKVICDYHCPTSQFNHPSHRDAECAYTKALYAHLDLHQAQAQRIHESVQARERDWAERKLARLAEEVRPELTPGVRRLRVLSD